LEHDDNQQTYHIALWALFPIALERPSFHQLANGNLQLEHHDQGRCIDSRRDAAILVRTGRAGARQKSSPAHDRGCKQDC
jgi:hypothetical protein